MISEFPTPWNFKLTWSLHKVKMISQFPPPWNFKLTWDQNSHLQTDLESPQGKDDIKISTPELQTDLGSHKVKMISKFPPPWNFKLAWSLHKLKMISKFPPPWSFKLTWSLHKAKMISKFPPPWHFKLTWSLHKVKTPTPMELQADLESRQVKDDIKFPPP